MVPSAEALAAFALASIILIVVPGPSVLFVVGRSLSLGRRAGLLTVLGNELGVLPIIAAVAFGVGAIIAESVVLFTAIKFLGAAYLIYLGIMAIRHRHSGVNEVDAPSAGPLTAGRVLLQGFIVGVTNPKSIIFFGAALPQFVDFHAGMVPLQMMVLGLVFAVIALVSDAVWALLAGTARAWFARSPRRIAATRTTGGVMMIGLGGALVLTGSRS